MLGDFIITFINKLWDYQSLFIMKHISNYENEQLMFHCSIINFYVIVHMFLFMFHIHGFRDDFKRQIAL